MFDRLIGMETEYALRFHPRPASGERIANADLFRRLLDHLRSKLPIAPSLTIEGFSPHTWFLANGGGVRFERILFFSFLRRAGLVEGMTPECRGPLQLLTHQRAQDVLLSEAAAASAGDSGDATLLKNNCDGHGNYYGSHENYEATVASGTTLLFWRAGLVVLLPVLFGLAILIELVMWALVGVLYAVTFLVGRLLRQREGPQRPWEVGATLVFDVLLLPLRVTFTTFVGLTAFRHQRERLLAFLISRPVMAGSGMLGADGRFRLSARAGVIGSVCGVVHKRSRPVFLFNHVMNDMARPLLGDGMSYVNLFRSRQRLQISVGDSNMMQTAEYLKIGATLLVLDAIEAGALEDAPRLKSPLRALLAICADPTLQATVPLIGGRHWTALQIQRFYLERCRAFVQRAGAAPAEAGAVLRLWEHTLDALKRDPRELVGKLDWVTKRHLLQESGRGGSLDARRKIDLRYHELSQAGYYLQLEAAGVAATLVEPEEIRRGTVAPPPGTRAAVRGQLIREHVGAGQPIRASWSTVVIGQGKSSRVIRFP